MPDIICPNCGKTGPLPESAVGLTIRCPRCQERFTVPGSSKAPVVRKRPASERTEAVGYEAVDYDEAVEAIEVETVTFERFETVTVERNAEYVSSTTPSSSVHKEPWYYGHIEGLAKGWIRAAIIAPIAFGVILTIVFALMWMQYGIQANGIVIYVIGLVVIAALGYAGYMVALFWASFALLGVDIGRNVRGVCRNTE